MTKKRSAYFLTILQASFFLVCLLIVQFGQIFAEGLPLYYWQQPKFINFGDRISQHIVERMVNQPVQIFQKKARNNPKKLLAVGSILYFANDHDVVWGSGLNGKTPFKQQYEFSQLDIRSVRGPITRSFLTENFPISCPEIYGDPALLFPYLFPEFVKSEHPKYDYIVIPHFTEKALFPQSPSKNIVYPTEPWEDVISKILDSKFVISSSLHGVIIAEAYGIPARMLRVTENEKILKYQDYYMGTNRPDFLFATSVEEALHMGGEKPFKCDLQKLYDAFPFDYWPNSQPTMPQFPS